MLELIDFLSARPWTMLRFLSVTCCLAAGRRQWTTYDETLGSGQHAGVFGYDMRYYFENNSDATANTPSYKTTTWGGRHNTSGDLATGTPYITKVRLQPGAAFPGNASYYLGDNAHYIVVDGNVSFTMSAPMPPPGDDDEAAAGGGGTVDPEVAVAHGYGDTFWVMGGERHGPARCLSDTACTFHVVGEAFSPSKAGAPDPADGPSVTGSLARSRSYLRADGEWGANPSPHSDACMANGGVFNMNFPAVNGTPPLLRVRWAPNCSIPFHYHPTGAMYFILYGHMMFRGDLVAYDTVFDKGDVRWVRPGYDYGPEYNSATEAMEITVLGTDTPPEFKAAPAGPYKMQKTIDVTHIF